MRPHSPLSPVAAFASALALGCAEPQSPTTAADLPGPSFRTERGTAEFGYAFGDEHYTVFVGLGFEDVVSLCEGIGFNVASWDQLTVIRPEGREGFEESLKQLTRSKEVILTVFASPAGTPACDLLETFHSTGTGQAIFTDNDVLLTHHGDNSFNFRVTGTVTDEGGQRYHLTGRVHAVLSRESTLDNFIFQIFFQRVQLTPIGG